MHRLDHIRGTASRGPRTQLELRHAPAAGRRVRLSLLMPAYNEERTIARAVANVLAARYPCEIELVVVDDGSTDRTAELLAAIDDPRVIRTRHLRNRGKGAALLTAARLATGTHVLIFDADLEYAPDDIPALLGPVLKGRCEVVYGARIFGMNTVYQSYHQALGNRVTTLAANVLFNASLTDMHTCLKLLPIGLFRRLELTERGFGLDTEITAKLLRLGIRPFEVPVSYHSRSRAEGKKLTWYDGVECLRILARTRFAASPLAARRTAPALPLQQPRALPSRSDALAGAGIRDQLGSASAAVGG